MRPVHEAERVTRLEGDPRMAIESAPLAHWWSTPLRLAPHCIRCMHTMADANETACRHCKTRCVNHRAALPGESPLEVQREDERKRSRERARAMARKKARAK